MTTFSVKLVDHRSSTNDEMSHIKSHIQTWMGSAFDGTSDSVSVSWGSGAKSDHVVIHFVQDIASSFIRDKSRFPNARIDPKAGGHTHSTGKGASCTELYRETPSGKIRLRRYGALAFHEALHNLFPFRDDVHTAMGDNIAAANIPDAMPNDDNKAWLRKGFSGKQIDQIF